MAEAFPNSGNEVVQSPFFPFAIFVVHIHDKTHLFGDGKALARRSQISIPQSATWIIWTYMPIGSSSNLTQ